MSDTARTRRAHAKRAQQEIRASYKAASSEQRGASDNPDDGVVERSRATA